jgi:SGNH domain (fused to AT3 domains)
MIIEPSLSLGGRIACGLLTVACATASYRLLEQPIRWNNWLSSKAIRSATLGLALTLTGALVALGADTFSKRWLSPTQRMIEGVSWEGPTASSRDCLLEATAAEPLTCTFGAVESSRTIVLLGDSHADQWSTPLVALAEQESWRVVTFLKASCPVADIPAYNFRLRRSWPECEEWRSRALAEIVRMRPDAVIVGQFSSSYVSDPSKSLNAGLVAKWEEGLRRSLGTLDDAGISIILLRDTPVPGRNIKHCLARADWRNYPISDCATPRSLALPAGVVEAERDVVASLRGAHFIDLSGEFCDSISCPAVRQETIVYRDSHHLTTAYARRLLKPLRDALLPIIDHRALRPPERKY